MFALIEGTVSYLNMHLLVELPGQPGWVALTPRGKSHREAAASACGGIGEPDVPMYLLATATRSAGAEHLSIGPADAATTLLCVVLALGSCFPAGWRGAVAWPDDAVFVGVDSDLHPVPQAELGEDTDDVALDGGLAEVEPGGDFGIRQALGHEAHDAEFAFAEAPGSTGN
jgi:hypothetical protein